jgi:hypothetical protein
MAEVRFVIVTEVPPLPEAGVQEFALMVVLVDTVKVVSATADPVPPLATGSTPLTSALSDTALEVRADSFTPSFEAGAAACRMPAAAVAGSLYRKAVPPVAGAAKPALLAVSAGMLPEPATKLIAAGVVPVPVKPGADKATLEVQRFELAVSLGVPVSDVPNDAPAGSVIAPVLAL